MKISVVTLGCKVNQCESDGIVKLLVDLGHEVSQSIQYADMYIINTCAVTSEAEKKSRQMITRVRKCNPSAKIYVCGCASQNNAEQFVDRGVEFVSGNALKTRLTRDFGLSGVDVAELPLSYEDDFPLSSVRTRDYVKIQDGCDNFCTYCIVPYLRGRSRSRDISSILEDISSSNALEIVLTGIDISSYSTEGGGLEVLARALRGCTKRLRLGSLEVRVISESLLQALSEIEGFCPHFHLSLQSGSDSVLKRMNRHYTSSEYLDKVRMIRRYFPNSAITTDVIVAFPLETDSEAEETIRLIEQVGFSDIHIFVYSPRPGTVAYDMPTVDARVAEERRSRLASIKSKLINDFCRANFTPLEVLIEEQKDGYFVGYSTNYVRVYTTSPVELGKVYRLTPTQLIFDGVLAVEEK